MLSESVSGCFVLKLNVYASQRVCGYARETVVWGRDSERVRKRGCVDQTESDRGCVG